MKIWITRQTAFSIQCGGLERLQVWFRKPTWVDEYRTYEEDQLPFGRDTTDMNGRKISGWEIRKGGTMWIDNFISFGKLFGYEDRDNESDNKISKFVWEKVCEHFGNTDFKEWHEYEIQHAECSIQNFLLVIDLNVSINEST